MARSMDEGELIEHWKLVGDELGLLVGRTGPSKLALALWLKIGGSPPPERSRILAGSAGPRCAVAAVPLLRLLLLG